MLKLLGKKEFRQEKKNHVRDRMPGISETEKSGIDLKIRAAGISETARKYKRIGEGENFKEKLL